MMWIIWMFIPYFTWAGWLHVGIRTSQNRYFKLAMIYTVPFALYLLGGEGVVPLVAVAWIVGIIHALKLRDTVNLEIKTARETQSDAKQSTQTNWKPADDVQVFTPSPKAKVAQRKDTAFRRFCRLFDRTPRRVAKRSANPTNAPETLSASLEKVDLELDEVDVTAPEPVNINSATEEEIASLPGIGPLMAKKAVQYRETERLFHSAEDFANVLKLTPHILGLLRPVLVVDQTEASPPKKQPGGRVVDY